MHRPTQDEIVDKVFRFVSANRRNRIKEDFAAFIRKIELTPQTAMLTLEMLEKDKYIAVEGLSYVLTSRGRDVIRSGGWIRWQRWQRSR